MKGGFILRFRMVYCDREQEVINMNFPVSMRGVRITSLDIEGFGFFPSDFPVNLHPNGRVENWEGYTGNNVLLRMFIKGKMQDIDLSRVHTEKCLDCLARDYNPGIEKHLCVNPIECAAVFPDVTDHVKMGYKPGEKIRRNYPQLEDNYFT